MPVNPLIRWLVFWLMDLDDQVTFSSASTESRYQPGGRSGPFFDAHRNHFEHDLGEGDCNAGANDKPIFGCSGYEFSVNLSPRTQEPNGFVVGKRVSLHLLICGSRSIHKKKP